VRLLIAGGGTGGHLFPGVALAEEVVTRRPGNRVLFVGTEAGLEATVIPREGYPIEFIKVRQLRGGGLLGFLMGLLAVPAAILYSVRILRRFKPDVVIGVGGYASGPVVLAAWALRIPVALQEQNAVPGLTNRILGRFVHAAFTAFDEAEPYFSRGKVHKLGNPIRRAFLDNFLRAKLDQSKCGMLIFGGSQGAHALNMRVLEAMPHLADMRDRLCIVHQTGVADLEAVKRGYEALGIKAEVKEFIQDMSDAYSKAELIVSRAGASTLAELAVCKKAAILVPYPFAADNHQELNARALVAAGAAVMIREPELTGERLAQEVRALLDNREALARMELASARLGQPEAAREIADVCVQLMVERWGANGRPAPSPTTHA
jgi:UDP-N-acetylglucosamine--N-acetylmuramyl-(pentapeptide) pyrophosphoryl-undecaprenol N-acetylglucosamine transferase